MDLSRRNSRTPPWIVECPTHARRPTGEAGRTTTVCPRGAAVITSRPQGGPREHGDAADRHGCEFNDIIGHVDGSTPALLLTQGIYGTLALPLMGGEEFRQV